jgi:2-polyprenyl-3-methyl-5-hydroxy-6-metoxy-1,4-benzoquinol methylase
VKSTEETISCLLCGHQRFRRLFTVGGCALWQCRQCGLSQTVPLPPADDSDALYDHGYFEGLVQRKPQETVYQARLLDLLEQFKRPRPDARKMLEVGIGVGIFMELAHDRGWQIEGVDPSQAACRYVSETLHLPTHPGALETLRLPAQQFDAIVLRHVLEHVPAPQPFLHELHRILKDDGLICLAVPNFGGLHARLERAAWFHLSLPYHVAHYTPAALTRLVTACNFEIIRRVTLDLSCSSYLIQLLNLVLRALRRPPANMYVSPQETDPRKSLAHWIVAKERYFNALMARFGLGEEIVVVLRKQRRG